MFGPVGTSGSAGGAPRLGGTKRQRSAVLSESHSHGAPQTAFSDAVLIAFAWPVAGSPIHSSMPVSRVWVNANRLPSGEKPIHASFGFCGSVTLISVPSASVFSVMLRSAWKRCGPLVRGLMRMPASRCIGCATSEIGGMLARSSSAITSPAGLTAAVGSGGASRMSTISFGGSWYCAAAACAAARTTTVRVASRVRRGIIRVLRPLLNQTAASMGRRLLERRRKSIPTSSRRRSSIRRRPCTRSSAARSRRHGRQAPRRLRRRLYAEPRRSWASRSSG
jgi:hypothetical protein